MLEMVTIDIPTPNIGDSGYYTFKEPFTGYISNLFNVDIEACKLRVTSIISIKDNVRGDSRDPFSDIYQPAGLSEGDYKLDIDNGIYLVSFSFCDGRGNEKFFRVPANYIASAPLENEVNYSSRMLLIDLGMLPEDIDLTSHYEDIKDYVSTRLGVEPKLKDITTGKPKTLPYDKHTMLETIRSNKVTVHETNNIQLEKLRVAYADLLDRLDELGITLA